MLKWSITLLTIGLSCNSPSIATPATGAAADLDLEEAAPVAVVGGEVVEVHVLDHETVAKVKLTHTYVGQVDATDASFLAYSGRQGVRGNYVFPAPRVGEIGIWAVKRGDQNLVSVSYAFHNRFPSRRDISKRYSHMESLATALEAAATNDRKERIEVLNRSVNSPVPEVARWSVPALAEMGPAEIDSMRARIGSDKALPTVGEVALDRVLCDIDAKGWGRSPVRRAMFTRWVTGTLSTDATLEVGTRLEQESQHSALDSDLLVAIATAGLANQRFGVEARLKLVYTLKWASVSLSQQDMAFEALANEMETNAEPRVRVAAANVIYESFRLSDRQILRLRGLAEVTDDTAVRALVRRAILEGKRRSSDETGK